MRFTIAATIAAAALFMATGALADGPVVATLQQPLTKRIQFVSNTAIWDCDGSACTSSNAQDMYFGASECHDVAKHAGAVSEFKNSTKTLQQPSLDRCNAGLSSSHAATVSH